MCVHYLFFLFLCIQCPQWVKYMPCLWQEKLKPKLEQTSRLIFQPTLFTASSRIATHACLWLQGQRHTSRPCQQKGKLCKKFKLLFFSYTPVDTGSAAHLKTFYVKGKVTENWSPCYSAKKSFGLFGQWVESLRSCRGHATKDH
jgi:hypothetical protein